MTNLRCVNGRREEVDKLVAEAAASVSALETQIHRQVLTARRHKLCCVYGRKRVSGRGPQIRHSRALRRCDARESLHPLRTNVSFVTLNLISACTKQASLARLRRPCKYAHDPTDAAAAPFASVCSRCEMSSAESDTIVPVSIVAIPPRRTFLPLQFQLCQVASPPPKPPSLSHWGKIQDLK